MGLWALLEARSIEELRPMVPDSAIAYGATWLIKQYDGKPVLGWTPNPNRNDQRETFPGLSAHAPYVLDLAHRVLVTSSVPWTQMTSERRECLLALDSFSTQNGLALNNRVPDSDIYRMVSGRVLEMGTFLWYPWTLILSDRLGADVEVDPAERTIAKRISTRLLARDQAFSEHLEQAMTYELAENVLAVNFYLRRVAAESHKES